MQNDRYLNLSTPSKHFPWNLLGRGLFNCIHRMNIPPGPLARGSSTVIDRAACCSPHVRQAEKVPFCYTTVLLDSPQIRQKNKACEHFQWLDVRNNQRKKKLSGEKTIAAFVLANSEKSFLLKGRSRKIWPFATVQVHITLSESFRVAVGEWQAPETIIWLSRWCPWTGPEDIFLWSFKSEVKHFTDSATLSD